MPRTALAVCRRYSPAAGFGVQLNVNNLSTVTPWFNEMVVLPNAWTADPANTWEFMLGQAQRPQSDARTLFLKVGECGGHRAFAVGFARIAPTLSF